ncbi:MAG: nucleotidyltransferase family protein [Thermocladium sp.]
MIYGVVLAAGLGERLRPLTLSIPKPLLPTIDGPVMMGAIRKLLSINAKTYVVLHYMADLAIPAVKSIGKSMNADIGIVIHDKLMGTAGHLGFLKGVVNDDDAVIVANGDIVMDEGFEGMLSRHLERGWDMTIMVTRVKQQVRFGVLELDENGELIKWSEKPVLEFPISAGNYVLRGKAIKELPDSFIDMDAFVKLLLSKGYRIGSYEASGSKRDVGTMDDYLSLLRAEYLRSN